MLTCKCFTVNRYGKSGKRYNVVKSGYIQSYTYHNIVIQYYLNVEYNLGVTTVELR